MSESFVERRKKLLEERGLLQPEEPVWEKRFIPDVGPLGGISDAAEAVNEACESIEIFDVYDRLYGGKREEPRGRTESIKAQCPAHQENKPSAWFGIKDGKWMLCCGHDMSIGWDKYKLAAHCYGLDAPGQHFEVKKRLAKEFRGVSYEKPAPPEPPTPRTEVAEPDVQPEPDPWEQEVERQKNKRLIQLEGDDRARRQRSSGLFSPPVYFDDLEAELSEPEPEVVWTIDRLHSVGTNTTITAGYKVGKTTFMMNLVAALVDHEKFLGVHEVRELAGRVAYWNYEVPEHVMRSSFREMSIRKASRIWHLGLKGQNFKIMDDAAMEWAIAELKRQEIEVWILDPYSDAIAGDENDNAEVSAFTRRLDYIKTEAGIADLFLPLHTGRVVEEGRERARGGSKIDDWPDTRWILAKHSETDDRYFRAEGRRVDVAERELHYKREDNSLTYSIFKGTRKQKAGNVVRGEILAYISANPGCGAREIETGISGKAEATRIELKKLISGFDVVMVTGANRKNHHYIQGQQPLGSGA